MRIGPAFVLLIALFGAALLSGCNQSGPTQQSLEQSQREIDEANKKSGAQQDPI